VIQRQRRSLEVLAASGRQRADVSFR
jgi:hypothetical protein